MRLQLNMLNIKDVKFAGKTEIRDNVLNIDLHELRRLLQQDRRFSKVDIKLAHPGEKCRILRVVDVVEPRAKNAIIGEDFPGALSKQGTVGEGSTCVLRGVAVVISDMLESKSPSEDQIGPLIDMSGPGSEVSIYGKTHNVVLLPYPADGTSADDYVVALKVTGLKAAVYLAQAGKELEPEDIRIYELPPLTQVTKGMEQLPRVAYIFQLYMNQFPPLEGEPILYGDNIRTLIPTIIHPNEVLDGAIINAYRGGLFEETYVIQNHPLIEELYRRHGKDLCFVGVVLTIAHSTEAESERTVAIAARLVKSILGADGVILTKAGGGAPEIAMVQTADKCEELGMRTVAIIWRRLESSDVGGTFFDLPRVNARVSTGVVEELVSLPSMEKIIGRPISCYSGPPVDGELKRVRWRIAGAADQLGYSNLIAVTH